MQVQTRRVPLVCFGLLLIGAAVFIQSVASQLPERVATHFDSTGLPNGYMTREGCHVFMLVFTLGVPLFAAATTGLMPRLFPPAFVNIPNREYWLAPERAADSLAYLSGQGIWLGCILLLFLCGVDWLIVSANSAAPPRLPGRPFEIALLLFLVALGLWVTRMFKRFGKAPK
jgi:serine/threonine-protein kinase